MATQIKDLYWAAGFLEGEGAFTAVSAGKRSDGTVRATFNAMVSAGQVNREPLERIQRMFGGYIYKHNMHTGNPLWRWQLNGNKGIGLMMTLWSLMSKRRQLQIETSISRWKSNLSQEAGVKAYWKEKGGRR